MLKSSSLLVAVFSSLFLWAAEAAAQTPTDSLGGKTVHVYLPSPGIDTLVVQVMNARMAQEAQYWYSYTFTNAGLSDYPNGFYFTDPSHHNFFAKSGLASTETAHFTVSDFQGAREIWILVDPAGPVNAPPVIMTHAPKTVNILNPWSVTAPKLISSGKAQGMTTVSGHCGWFSAMLLDTTITQGYFSEINDTGSYGKKGFADKADFDFASLFTQFGPALWLNTVTDTWTGAFPNVEGNCQYPLTMTVRDFSKDHPDFDFSLLSGDFTLKGMVLATLGTDGKPVRSTVASKAPVTFDTFDTWWKTDSTHATPTMRSYEGCYDLSMTKSNDGQWEYDSYRDSPDHGFWPAEGAANHFPAEAVNACYVKPPPDAIWVTNGSKRNGNFCSEAHASFTYVPGQRFAFRGDQDVWVFIDGRLVIDLGGIHEPKSDSIELDKLGLIPGNPYPFDFFQCNRQPCGSALRLKTSIAFQQRLPLYGTTKAGPAPGSVAMEIWKHTGGPGSCTIPRTATDTIKAGNLTYQLLDAAGGLVKELTTGSTYYGCVTIAEPVITVDTSKLAVNSGLTPGSAYRIVAFEPANPDVKVGLTFRVRPGATGLRRIMPSVRGVRPKSVYRNILGRRVPAFPGRVNSPWVPDAKAVP